MERAVPRSEPITVLVACDEPIRAAALCLLLESGGSTTVVGQAADVASAVRITTELRPRVAVVDAGLANGSGVEAVRRIHRVTPETGVVVLARGSEPSCARRALEAGALAYLGPGADPDQLGRAIESASLGEEFGQGDLARLVAADPVREKRDSLTDREREVLRLVALGHTNREIARSLYLSVRTVESHRAGLMRKLGARSRADLVLYAMRIGLVEGGARTSTS